jgi:hypothetical protein
MKHLPKIILLTLIIAAIAVPIGIYSYGKARFTEKYAIGVNWGVAIPEDFNEEYHTRTLSFHGDGERYTVYDASPQNSFVSGFSAVKDREIETFVSEIIQRLEVPADYQPDYKTVYAWKKNQKSDNSTLVMLYSSESKRLYVVQEFF